MHRRDRWWRLRSGLLVAGDLLAGTLSYLLAFVVRVFVPLPLTADYLPPLRFAEVHHHWAPLLFVQVAALYFLGCYEPRALARPRDILRSLAVAPVFVSLVLIAIYFFRADLVFPRSIFLVFAAGDALLLIAWRVACGELLSPYPRRRVVVVGTSESAAEVVRTIGHQSWLGMDVVGVVADASEPSTVGAPWLGPRKMLPEVIRRHDVDEVIIASEVSWQDHLLHTLGQTEGVRARVYVVPSPFEILIARPEHLRLHDIPLIEVMRDRPRMGGGWPKRVFDVVVASALLVVLGPVMLAIAAVIPRPRLYRQARVGRSGRAFTMFKFRTMRVDAERDTGPVLAAENDPRVTWFGRVLRATRLDELPQLFNVLRGEMSFVGPRPERPEFVAQYISDIQGYSERLRVRPGLTGYAQVNGEYHTSPTTKLKYDLSYIHNHSLWLDLKILSGTFKVMLTRRGV